MAKDVKRRDVLIAPHELPGILYFPEHPEALIVFAHGSGSSRLSPRNAYAAERLASNGLACLLFDLLTPAEAEDRSNVFDIPLLAERVLDAVDWAAGEAQLSQLPVGLFGASTGAAAALVAASETPSQIYAVVSRGGRPDLAGDALRRVASPTLLVVGGFDEDVLELNREALAQMRCEARLDIVPGATHLFEEPGKLDEALVKAANWFATHLSR